MKSFVVILLFYVFLVQSYALQMINSLIKFPSVRVTTIKFPNLSPIPGPQDLCKPENKTEVPACPSLPPQQSSSITIDSCNFNVSEMTQETLKTQETTTTEIADLNSLCMTGSTTVAAVSVSAETSTYSNTVIISKISCPNLSAVPEMHDSCKPGNKTELPTTPLQSGDSCEAKQETLNTQETAATELANLSNLCMTGSTIMPSVSTAETSICSNTTQASVDPCVTVQISTDTTNALCSRVNVTKSCRRV